MTSNTKDILSNNILYAKIIDFNYIPEGLRFYTQDNDFLQVGSWHHKKGHTTKPHGHTQCERTSSTTQELIYVKQGELKVTIYDMEDNIISTHFLKEGKAILCFAGGHKYEITEENTQVLEVKNGPYLGVEKDKREISNG